MKVTIIGAGYVGLVSGACFADFGHGVTCVDSNPEKIARLMGGDIPIYEPGLDELVDRNRREQRLFFTTNLAEGIIDAEVVFIAVGTPSRRGDGHADLSYVFAAADEIAAHLSSFKVVVIKSTVPVGSGDEVEARIKSIRPDADFAMASNPEFLREGAAIEDFKRPDRIVVGVDDERAAAVMRELYRPLSLNETPILFVTRRTAELVKYAANAFLAMKVTYINEIADLCEKVGANVQHVARGIGLDRRIGAKFLHAGPGYGGSCFPKDTLALVQTARAAGRPLRLIEATVQVNDARKIAMAHRIMDAIGDRIDGARIALLGLTFKPNTDDMRDAPAIDIATTLMLHGAEIVAHDPQGMKEASRYLPGVRFAKDPYEAVSDADAIVVTTEWDQFRALDLERLRKLVRTARLFDLRNIYEPHIVRAAGFEYYSVGRPDPNGTPEISRQFTRSSATDQELSPAEGQA